jgi:hypothetical protein
MSKWILNENNEKNLLIGSQQKNRRNVTKARKINEVVEFKIFK